MKPVKPKSLPKIFITELLRTLHIFLLMVVFSLTVLIYTQFTITAREPVDQATEDLRRL